MFNVVLLAGGILLVALGAEPLFHAATNREQVTTSCEAFAQSPPRALWLRITGCEVDYLGAGYRERNGRIVELYFPARPAGSSRDMPAPIVATTSDASVLAIAEGTIGGGRTPDQEQFIVMMLKIITALRAAREIEGYAHASVLGRLAARSDLAALSSPLSPDVLMIDLHAKPRVLAPAAAAAVGLVLLGTFVMLRSRGRAPAHHDAAGLAADEWDDDSTPGQVDAAVDSARRDAAMPPDGALAGAKVEPATERTWRLLVLNLAPEVGAEGIETAPPLGSRAEVRQRLAQLLSGVQFEESGAATIRRGDSALLTIDMGAGEPVAAAVVTARGREAADLLGRVLEGTGWRAYDPRSGAFVPAPGPQRASDRPADHPAA